MSHIKPHIRRFEGLWTGWNEGYRRFGLQCRYTVHYVLLINKFVALETGTLAKTIEHCIVELQFSVQIVYKKLSYCWETVRRESMPRIAEMDVEMTT